MPRSPSEIKSELRSIERMLGSLGPEAEIERFSLEQRREHLNQALAALGPAPPRAEKGLLVFDGRPVAGTRGVYLDFVADVLRPFGEALTCIAASVSHGPLSARGPIPQRESHRLLVTGTARGSFGFELEPEVPTGQQKLTDLPMAVALDTALEFLESTTESDERLSDALEKMDDRAIGHMRTFLGKLQANDAICGLTIGKRCFRFPDVAAVSSGLARIAGENIHEETSDRQIVVRGVLPLHRRMEFSWPNDDDIQYALISADVEDPGLLNEHLGGEVQVTIRSRTVGGATPRYTVVGVGN